MQIRLSCPKHNHTYFSYSLFWALTLIIFATPNLHNGKRNIAQQTLKKAGSSFECSQLRVLQMSLLWMPTATYYFFSTWSQPVYQRLSQPIPQIASRDCLSPVTFGHICCDCHKVKINVGTTLLDNFHGIGMKHHKQKPQSYIEQ